MEGLEQKASEDGAPVPEYAVTQVSGRVTASYVLEASFP